MNDRMKKFFEAETPQGTEDIKDGYLTLCNLVIGNIPEGPERTVALRKLLESRDSAIRSCLFGGL